MELTERIYATGWHCCTHFGPKPELAPAFWGSDAQPLDAPYWIAAGGATKTTDGVVVGVATWRD